MELLANIPTGALAVFWGILTFSILVVVHEGGHFLAARLFGVSVHEFMIGLPGPSLRFRSKKSGVYYGVTAFPLGGYVRIAGMEPGTEDELLAPAAGMLADERRVDADALAVRLDVLHDRAAALLTTLEDYRAADPVPDSPQFTSLIDRSAGETDAALLDRVRTTVFRGQRPWKRITILAMGVVFNLVSAILIFTVTLSVWGVPQATRTVASVLPRSAAAAAGIRAGDTITTIDGVAVKSWDQVRARIAASHPGSRLALVVRRADGMHRLTPVLGSSNGVPLLGVRVTTEDVRMPVLKAFTESMHWTGLVFSAVGKFFVPATFVKSVSNARSIVGISYEVASAAKAGPINYAWMFALLSLSLGVMNILPIPPLDGGKVALEFVEWIRHRPLRREVTLGFSAVGAALLFSLIFYLMYADVMRYIVKG